MSGRMYGRILFVAGLIVWLCETWYYGWNLAPCCRAEGIWDLIGGGSLGAGVAVYFFCEPDKFRRKLKLCWKIIRADQFIVETDDHLNVGMERWRILEHCKDLVAFIQEETDQEAAVDEAKKIINQNNQ